MLVTKSCPALCDPRDYSPPGSSVLEFSRQEYWSGLPFLSPGDLPDPGIESRSPALQADSFTVWATGEAPHRLWEVFKEEDFENHECWDPRVTKFWKSMLMRLYLYSLASRAWDIHITFMSKKLKQSVIENWLNKLWYLLVIWNGDMNIFIDVQRGSQYYWAE